MIYNISDFCHKYHGMIDGKISTAAYLWSNVMKQNNSSIIIVMDFLIDWKSSIGVVTKCQSLQRN